MKGDKMTTTEIKQTTMISITLSLTTVIVAIIFCIVAYPQTAYADELCYESAQTWKKSSISLTKKAKKLKKKIKGRELKNKIATAITGYEKAAKVLWQYAKAQKNDLRDIHKTGAFSKLNMSTSRLDVAVKGNDSLENIVEELKKLKTKIYKACDPLRGDREKQFR